ncbi:hypothetical protein GCM10007879_21220 [Maritalea porphyrae]|uniref:Uncharacterized protein n=1 Tax=Maritalea porphyrae TaxID=880732 RepID=A0ABQ5UTH8_9HYPH|nr:hypothetical protein GCM10007879_21220 [Maritalea porphyrae]
MRNNVDIAKSFILGGVVRKWTPELSNQFEMANDQTPMFAKKTICAAFGDPLSKCRIEPRPKTTKNNSAITDAG